MQPHTYSLLSAPAEAARQINPPAWFVCDKYPATISVSPPRIWSSYRTEQVGWFIQIQRWNGARWYKYGDQLEFWSSFNTFGQGVTSWSGGRYHNNTLNLRVAHRGSYRVATVVGGMQGGVSWSGYIGGRNASCYIS